MIHKITSNLPLRLAIAALSSLAIHYFLLKPENKENAKAAGGKSAAVEIQEEIKSKTQSAQKIKVAKPKTIAEKAKELKATQSTSNDERLKENAGGAQRKAVQEQVKAAQESIKTPDATVSVNKNTKAADFIKTDPKKKAIAEKERPKKETAKTLPQKMSQLKNEKKKTIKTNISRGEYYSNLKRQHIGRLKGVKVPQLITIFKDNEELLKVHKYFGMKIIAYKKPPNHRNVVDITINSMEGPSYQTISDFNFRNYGSRHYPRTAPFFNRFKKEIESKQLLGNGDVGLYTITPISADNYFRYKQKKVIEDNGYQSKDVARCIGSFYKFSNDIRIFRIAFLQLFSGETVAVSDFEYNKLAGQ